MIYRAGNKVHLYELLYVASLRNIKKEARFYFEGEYINRGILIYIVCIRIECILYYYSTYSILLRIFHINIHRREFVSQKWWSTNLFNSVKRCSRYTTSLTRMLKSGDGRWERWRRRSAATNDDRIIVINLSFLTTRSANTMITCTSTISNHGYIPRANTPSR